MIIPPRLDSLIFRGEKKMAINLQSTNSVSNAGIKMLVYGAAGTGKTYLIPTLPSPVILSAEGGLLSISHHNIPFVEI